MRIAREGDGGAAVAGDAGMRGSRVEGAGIVAAAVVATR
jgi:hypothetical protein